MAPTCAATRVLPLLPRGSRSRPSRPRRSPTKSRPGARAQGARSRDAAASADRCAALAADGRCLIYAVRPVVCRSHGAPIRLRENSLPVVQACRENFTARGPAAADADCILDQTTLSAMVSYQLAGENEYDTDFFRSSGLATARSDYVGGLYIQALSNLGFSAQSRFDESTWDIQRTDLGTFARYGPAQLRVNYADVIGEPGLAQDEPREEIVTAGVLALTEDWSLLGNLRYDLETSQTITDGVGLRYQDDCFLLDVTYQRSFIQDQDIAPDQRFLVNFALKYLGTYQVATDASSVFGTGGSDSNN